jgi:sec-independent protein translocase protein TatC
VATSVPAQQPGRRAGRKQPRPADGRMSLVEHLRELRNRLGISLLALAVAVIVVFVLWLPVYEFLKQPYCATTRGAEDCSLFSLGIFDQFKVRLRVAFLGGVVLSSPVWLYQLGAFITPALHRNERRYALGFLCASLLLFAAGAVFAYLTVSRGLDFLLEIGGPDIEVIVSIQSYLSFVTLTLLAFGVGFEFPVVVLFLHLVGLFPAAKMRAWRRGMVVAIFAGAAIITPSQDPFTFTILALPLILLYEGCILFARARERNQRRRLAADPVAALDDDETSALDARTGYESAMTWDDEERSTR